jgi:SHS2 domain-containing protein
MAGTFRWLEDVALADAAFEASGATLSDLFQAAGQAVIEALADPETVKQSWQRIIEHEAPDPGTLLFIWLSDLVFFKDAEGVVYHSVSADVGEKQLGAGWRLRSTVTGSPINPATQELRADVKGVTKHLFDVRQDRTGWMARVVLDL